MSLFKGKEGFNEAVTTKVYYSGQNGAIVNADAYRQAVSIAYGHYIISCPTWNFAKRLYASDQTSSVYQWYYTAKEGNYAKWMCKSWEKACHTNDLFPAFGVPFRFPEKFTNRERDVSNEVIDFLKHFVYTGYVTTIGLHFNFNASSKQETRPKSEGMGTVLCGTGTR